MVLPPLSIFFVHPDGVKNKLGMLTSLAYFNVEALIGDGITDSYTFWIASLRSQRRQNWKFYLFDARKASIFASEAKQSSKQSEIFYKNPLTSIGISRTIAPFPPYRCSLPFDYFLRTFS